MGYIKSICKIWQRLWQDSADESQWLMNYERKSYLKNDDWEWIKINF